MMQKLTSDNQNSKLAFWLGAYVFAIVMLGTTLPTPLYPIYQAHLGFTNLMITIIYATYAVGVILTLVVCGKWSDQVGRKPLLLGGIFLSIISAVFFLFGTDSLSLLIIGRFFSGLSAGIFTGTATAIVVEHGVEHTGDHDHSTMIATAANMGGLGLGPLLAGILAEYAPIPLQLSYFVHLGLLVVGLFMMQYIHETVEVEENPKLKVQRLGLPEETRPVFIPAAIAGFAGFVVLGFFCSVAPAVVGKLLHVSNLASIGGIIFLIFIASILGQYILKWLPGRWALLIGCMVLIIGVATVGLGIGLPSLKFITVGAVISGCGQGLILRSGMTDVMAATPISKRGEVTSLFFVVMYIAISVPVIAIGLMIDRFGLRTAGVAFSICVAGLTLIALLILLYRFIRSQMVQPEKGLR